jgi:hypothetical protein
MPCNSSHLEPTYRERESLAVCKLLDEVGITHGPYDYYGRVQTLDADTRALCDWCKAHPERIAGQSLELQIWWRDHQKADADKAARAEHDRKLREAQERALDKLSEEDIRALGLKVPEGDE